MASRALATAFVNIVPGTKDLEDYLKGKLKDDVEDGSDKAGKGGGKKLGSGMVDAAKSFVGPLIAAFSAFQAIDFFKGSIEAASTLSESQNAIKVTFGEASDAIAKLGEDSAKRLGLATSDFNGIAVQFSSFADKIAGPGGDISAIIDDISTRGADFASVMNLDVTESLAAFQSGLAGETEPLKKFGIDLSDAAIKQYALANGISDGSSEMTEAQKIQARYGALMEQTSKTAGDFANTSDGLANSQRIANAEMENARARMGEALLPIMAAVTTFASNMLIPIVDAIGGAFQWMVENVNISIPILSALGAILLAVLAPAIWAAITATWKFTAALLANPLTWIVLGIGLLIGAIVALIMNWDTVVKFVTDVWNGFMGFLSDSFGYIADWWNDLWSGVGRFLEDTWNNIVNFFKGVLGFVVDLFLNWTVYGFIIRNWETIRTFIVNLWGGIVTFFRDTLNNVGGFFESVFTGIGDFVRGIFDGMIRGIKGYVNALIDLINGVIGGINNVGSFIRDITGGAVNVKVGKIPRLAKGGFVDSPTTALIGEAGPEVVTPLRDFERMMGLDGNGRGNTVNYYAAPNQSIDAEQALFTAMKRAKVLAAW